MSARSCLDLWIVDARKDEITIEPKRRGVRGDCLRIVGIETKLEIADDNILCQQGRCPRVFVLEVIKGSNSRQTHLRMIGG